MVKKKQQKGYHLTLILQVNSLGASTVTEPRYVLYINEQTKVGICAPLLSRELEKNN